jgi:dsRNA-specific ribonuclease
MNLSGQFQKDAKTRLQEWLQGRKKPCQLSATRSYGAAHEQRFEVACEIESPVRLSAMAQAGVLPNRLLPTRL